MAAAVLGCPVQHCHRRNSVKPKICDGIESVKGFPQGFFFVLPENFRKDVAMGQRYPLLRSSQTASHGSLWNRSMTISMTIVTSTPMVDL
jgi:hypothetical protein